MATRNVLVTGGAGYLGAVLVPKLLASGWRVTVLDDFRASETSLLPCVPEPRFVAVRGDARDARTLRPLVREADAIVPLAAVVGAPACERAPFDAISLNRDAVRTLLGVRSASQRVLFPTTNSGYGHTDGAVPCDESAPQNPVSLYGRTKVEAERAVLDAENTVSFRLATLFGVSPRPRLDLLVNDFTWRAHRDRSVVLFESHYLRNFVAVGDAADLFVWALERDLALEPGAYNFGLSDANLTKRELCELIAGEVPGFTWTEAPAGRDPDQRNYLVDNRKIEAAGFAASTPVRDGVRELLRAFPMLSPGRYGNG